MGERRRRLDHEHVGSPRPTQSTVTSLCCFKPLSRKDSMDTISLKGEAAISLTELNEALSPRWWVEDAGHGRLVIQANGSRAYVYLESPSAFPEWGEVVL